MQEGGFFSESSIFFIYLDKDKTLTSVPPVGMNSS
jgi:hypothetical protein